MSIVEPNNRRAGIFALVAVSVAFVGLGLWLKAKPRETTPATPPGFAEVNSPIAGAPNRAGRQSAPRMGRGQIDPEGAGETAGFVAEEIAASPFESAIREKQDRLVELRARISADLHSAAELKYAEERTAEFSRILSETEPRKSEEVRREELNSWDGSRLLERELVSAVYELGRAQSEFDEWIRSVMTREQYAHYRAFEEDSASRAELKSIAAYAATNNLTLDPADDAGALNFLQSEQLLTRQGSSAGTGTSGGPYAGFSHGVSGTDSAQAMLREDLASTERALALLAPGKSPPSLSEAARRTLEAYYAAQRERILGQLAFLTNAAAQKRTGTNEAQFWRRGTNAAEQTRGRGTSRSQ